MTHLLSGKLEVKVIKAKIITSTESMGKMVNSNFYDFFCFLLKKYYFHY